MRDTRFLWLGIKSDMNLFKIDNNNDIVNLAVLFSEQKFNKDFIPLVNVTSFIKAVKSSKNKMIFSSIINFKYLLIWMN